jgi:hypothetical protein
MEKVCAELPTATLVKFEGANHSFKIKKEEVISDLVSQTNRWIVQILA